MTNNINWTLQTVGPWATSGIQLCFIGFTHSSKKIPIGYQHVKLGAFTLKLRSFFFFQFFGKRRLWQHWAWVSARCQLAGTKTVSFRWGVCLPADPVPTAPCCLSYDGPVSLFFVTWPVSLVFRACNSSRSFIPLVMMELCIPVKCQAVTVRFIRAPGLACRQMQGVWGGSGRAPLCPAMLCCTSWL